MCEEGQRVYLVDEQGRDIFRRIPLATTNYEGLPSLLVMALSAAMPLPVHLPRSSKPCSKCGWELPLEAFNREARARDGRRPECQTCERERRDSGHRKLTCGGRGAA
jgi:hypothetical protein